MSANSTDFTFSSPQGHALAATRVQTGAAAPAALLLHGAGNSYRHYLQYIADDLATYDIGSIRFDFSGWGISGGERLQQSLDLRVADALAAFPLLAGGAPRLIVGASMGAHIACRLLEYCTPDALVLFCPAAYAAAAEALSFATFATVLRETYSWRTAPIFPLLEAYRGRVLLITGEDDDVIPPEVIDRYRDACRNAQFCQLVLPGCPHGIQLWLQQPEHATLRRQVLDAIANVAAA